MTKKTIKTILAIITFTVILTAVIFNIDSVAGVVLKIGGLFSSFFIGVALAFILNVPMKFVEKRLLFKVNRRKIKRACSILLTLAFCAVVIMIVMFAVIPEIIKTVESIINNLPSIGRQIEDLMDTLGNYSQRFEEAVGSSQLNPTQILDEVATYVQGHMSNLSSSVISFVADTVGTIVGLVIGFVFSIYILASKEKLVCQFRMILFAYLKKERAQKIWNIVLLANHTFQRFISGQCLEACILGCMFFVTMSIFRMPYAVLISVVIGVLALITVIWQIRRDRSLNASLDRESLTVLLGRAVGVEALVSVLLISALILLTMMLQGVRWNAYTNFIYTELFHLYGWLTLAMAISGVAGWLMLWRRRRRLKTDDEIGTRGEHHD